MPDRTNSQPPNINDFKIPAPEAPQPNNDAPGYFIDFNLSQQRFLPYNFLKKIEKAIIENNNEEKNANTNANEPHQPLDQKAPKLKIFVPRDNKVVESFVKRIRMLEQRNREILMKDKKSTQYDRRDSIHSHIYRSREFLEQRLDTAHNFSAVLVDISILAVLFGIKITGSTFFVLTCLSVLFPLGLAFLHTYRYIKTAAALTEPKIESSHDKPTLFDKRTLITSNVAKMIGLALRGLGPHGLRLISIGSIAITSFINIDIALMMLAVGVILELVANVFLYQSYQKKYNEWILSLIQHMLPTYEKGYCNEYLINIHYIGLLNFIKDHPNNKTLQPFANSIINETFLLLKTVHAMMYDCLSIDKAKFNKQEVYFQSIFRDNHHHMQFYVRKKNDRLKKLKVKSIFAGIAALLMLALSLSQSSFISQNKLAFINSSRFEFIIALILIEVLTSSATYEYSEYIEARKKQQLNPGAVHNKNLFYFELAFMIVCGHVIAALTIGIREGSFKLQNIAAICFLTAGAMLVIASECMSARSKAIPKTVGINEAKNLVGNQSSTEGKVMFSLWKNTPKKEIRKIPQNDLLANSGENPETFLLKVFHANGRSPEQLLHVLAGLRAIQPDNAKADFHFNNVLSKGNENSKPTPHTPKVC